MKRHIALFIALIGLVPALYAQSVAGAKVENLKMERNGQYVVVDMDINLADIDVEGTRAVLLTPAIVNGADSISLRSIGIYGRNRYFYYKRNGDTTLSDDQEISYRAKEKPETMNYHMVIPYERWMHGSKLVFSRTDCGCCEDVLDKQTGTLIPRFPPEDYKPTFLYIRPTAERVKSRAISSSAYVDFPLNKTEIHTDYHDNRQELGKIIKMIDSVKNDIDITITRLVLKGYASPEGSYAINERLAKGRTEAVKNYVQELYHLDPAIITTTYEPENWEGLRRYVEQSNLTSKEGLLEIIDSDMEPDPKEWKLRTSFAADYKTLRNDCYPKLRRTDYEVDYTIRTYSDVKEIERIAQTAPQKLSLNEFYLLAETYEAGSDAWNDLFETAVRMYPNDEVANLNAANSSMQRGDLKSAERYLEKSGSRPEVTYARATLAMLKKEYELAEKYAIEAKEQGVAEAEKMLIGLDDYR